MCVVGGLVGTGGDLVGTYFGRSFLAVVWARWGFGGSSGSGGLDVPLLLVTPMGSTLRGCGSGGDGFGRSEVNMQGLRTPNVRPVGVVGSLFAKEILQNLAAYQWRALT